MFSQVFSLNIKAYFSKKPAKKILRLLGGKIKFEFYNIKFKFNFPAKETKDFLPGFLEKFAFNINSNIAKKTTVDANFVLMFKMTSLKSLSFLDFSANFRKFNNFCNLVETYLKRFFRPVSSQQNLEQLKFLKG